MLARTTVSRAWLALATAALVAGAVCALVVAVARTPTIGEAPGLRDLFAPALVLHVTLATHVWLLSMLAAIWSDFGPRGCAPAWRRALRRGACGVAAAGVVAMVLPAFLGSPAVLSNYVPVFGHPLFVAGLAAFVVSVALTGLLALLSGAQRDAPDAQRASPGVPHEQWPNRLASAAALLAVVPVLTALGAALIAWRSGAPDPSIAARAEEVFWGAGHLMQFSFLLLAQSAWLSLLGHRVARPRLAWCAIALTAAASLAGPVAHLLWPADSAEFRLAFTRLMQFATWPGPLLLVASTLRWWQPRGFRAAAPRGGLRDPATSAWVSIALLAAGVLAALLIGGETTMVPAHYHGTVGAATLAAVALALDRIGVRHSLVPSTFGAGFALLVCGLVLAGLARMPRKLPDPGAVAELLLSRVGIALMSLGALVAMAAIVAFGTRVAIAMRAAARQRRASSHGQWLERVGGFARTRDPQRRYPPDRRAVAFAATIAGVAVLGALLSWSGGGSPQRVSAPEARAHDADRLRAEIHQRFQQGVWMLHARQYEHALAAFHRVIEIDPAMPEAHANIGFALLGLGRHAQARDFFESSIELRREQMNAYFGLATALEALGDRAGAIGAMRAYVHLARADDPWLRKARSALWEWEARPQQKDARAG